MVNTLKEMINKNDFTTVNITLKIINHSLTEFENKLRRERDVISFEHLEDTSEMYKKDPVFKKMVKDAKLEKNRRLDYIIKNNYKFK